MAAGRRVSGKTQVSSLSFRLCSLVGPKAQGRTGAVGAWSTMEVPWLSAVPG